MKWIIILIVCIIACYASYIYYGRYESFQDPAFLIDSFGFENVDRFECSVKVSRNSWNRERYSFYTKKSSPIFNRIIPEGMIKKLDDVISEYKVDDLLDDVIVGFERLDGKNYIKIYTGNRLGGVGAEFEIDKVPITKYKFVGKRQYKSFNLDINSLSGWFTKEEFKELYPILARHHKILKKVNGDEIGYYFEISSEDIPIRKLEGFLTLFCPDIVKSDWYSNMKELPLYWIAVQKSNDKSYLNIYSREV